MGCAVLMVGLLITLAVLSKTPELRLIGKLLFGGTVLFSIWWWVSKKRKERAQDAVWMPNKEREHDARMTQLLALPISTPPPNVKRTDIDLERAISDLPLDAKSGLN